MRSAFCLAYAIFIQLEVLNQIFVPRLENSSHICVHTSCSQATRLSRDKAKAPPNAQSWASNAVITLLFDTKRYPRECKTFAWIAYRRRGGGTCHWFCRRGFREGVLYLSTSMLPLPTRFTCALIHSSCIRPSTFGTVTMLVHGHFCIVDNSSRLPIS